jgi:hypothetical protein
MNPKFSGRIELFTEVVDFDTLLLRAAHEKNT